MIDRRQVLIAAVPIALAVGFLLGRLSAPSANSAEQAKDASPSSRIVTALGEKSPTATAPGSAALAKEVDDALALHEAGKPGMVNWKLVDAMRETLYQTHSADRSRQWQILMGTMRPEDAAEVRKLFHEADSKGIWFLDQWNQFYNRWGQLDGAAALADITEHPNSGVGGTVSQAAKGWAASDPDAALQWFSEWDPDAFFWDKVYTGMVAGYARNDLRAATDLAIETASSRPHTLGVAMGQLADAVQLDSGIDGLVDWFEMLPDDNAIRESAFGHARYRVKRAGPDRLSEWLDSVADKPYRRDQDYVALAQEFARSDVNKALSWSSNLPPSPHDGTYTGIAEIVSQAVGSGDALSVQRWADANPAHPVTETVKALLETSASISTQP